MEFEKTQLVLAKQYKPWLRFGVGSVVFLLSDTKRRTPMTVVLLIYDDDEVDYRCTWLTTQKIKEVGCFHDLVLTL